MPGGSDQWAAALAEVESADRRDAGLWAKCFAEADGDDAKAKAAYVRARVQSGDDMGKTYCPNCGRECRADATICPACSATFGEGDWKPVSARPATGGKVDPPSSGKEEGGGSRIWLWIFGVPAAFVVLFLMVGHFAGNDPKAQERSLMSDAIAECWKQQERKSLDPGSARWVAGVCEKMESDFKAKWGRNP